MHDSHSLTKTTFNRNGAHALRFVASPEVVVICFGSLLDLLPFLCHCGTGAVLFFCFYTFVGRTKGGHHYVRNL
jgi:hypothetical protein